MAKSNQELTTKIQQAGAQAPAKTNGNGDLSPAGQVRHYLERMKGEIALALPTHITPDRMARVALTAIRTTPALLECSIDSLMAGVIQSAQLGLEPGILGHAYYVPYNKKIREQGKADRWVKEAQFQIGYKGLVELMMRSGRYQTINGDVIREHDAFEFEQGYEEKLKHVPNFEKPGRVIAVYAYYILKNGGRRARVFTVADVERIRRRSKNSGFNEDGSENKKANVPWVTDWEEMAKKTVLRNLSKIAPMSIEEREVIAKDENLEFGDDVNRIELNLGEPPAPALPEPATVEDAQAALEAKREELQYSADDLHFAETGEHLPDWDGMTEEEREKYRAVIR